MAKNDVLNAPSKIVKVSNRFDFTESKIEMNQFHAPNTF